MITLAPNHMNQNPEQLARDRIDDQLTACGWIIQNKASINLHAGIGVAIQEFQTDASSSDYVLFIDKKLINIVEAKYEESFNVIVHEEQPRAYINTRPKYLNNDPLFFFIKAYSNDVPCKLLWFQVRSFKKFVLEEE